MKVLLAGYNLDTDVIEELKRSAPPRSDVTPETLSASYARISRDPRPVNELRRAAREEVEKARRSNQNIIFKMGHHSVAEHAVFNFDVIGLSRLAIEELERFRLCSYTEKSQRYITLKDDFVLPEEVRRAGREELFISTVRAQNALYRTLFERLKPHVFGTYGELARNTRNHTILENLAKEDARYVVSLATQGQLGMTANARNLELLIRRFAGHGLSEIRELNTKIYALAKEVAPSIILFTEANDFDAKTYAELETAFLKQGKAVPAAGKAAPAARIVAASKDGDNRILAGLMHTASARPYSECLARASRLRPSAKKELFKKGFQYMEFYDSPQREFEYADLTFELVVSASCFAQLKRHRMATLTSQPYDPGLAVTVPRSIEEAGCRREFMDLMDRTNETYTRLKKDIGPAAAYVLTNAHRRRVLLKTNVRELYHISRLREDATAQWEIRELSASMSRLARRIMPVSCLLLGGKDAYPKVYERAFGRPPKLLPPEFWP